MTMNLRSNDCFVEDAGWHAAVARYSGFVQNHHDGRILHLELGVGYNTPGIIKYPFWRMTAQNKNATYVCINLEKSNCPEAIVHQSICMNADIGHVLESLKKTT